MGGLAPGLGRVGGSPGPLRGYDVSVALGVSSYYFPQYCMSHRFSVGTGLSTNIFFIGNNKQT